MNALPCLLPGRKLTVLFLSMVKAGLVVGQIGFVTSFGGGGAQDGVGVIAQDGEFWVASREFEPGTDRHQAVLYRRTGSGQALATIPLEVGGRPFLQGFIPAASGGGAIIGSVIRDDEHSHDGMVLRLNGSGSVQWIASPIRAGDQQYLGAAFLADGGALVCGVQHTGTGHDGLLVRISASGEVLWEAVDETPLDQELHAVAVDASGSIMATGRAVSFSGSTDLLVARYSLDGQQSWINFLGGGDHDEGRSIVSTGDGSFIIAGHSLSFGPVDGLGQRRERVLLAKVDLGGDTLWTRTYGDLDQGRRAYAMAIAQNDDLLLTGERYTSGSSDALVLRVDTNGGLLWERVFDLGDTERLLGVQALEDGFISCGWAFEAMGRQVLLIRRNADGF